MYQPAFQLSANSLQTIKLEFNDSATNAIVRQFAFTTGKATPQGGVLNTVKGYWNFDKGNLKASVGHDLRYLDDSVASLYEFGTTSQGAFAAVPNINGKPAKVIHVPFTGPDATNATAKLLGLKVNHGILPNGGGSKVNQWTMIMDLYWGDQFRIGFGAVFRTTNLGTPGDADMFWRASSFSYGKSCCSPYAGIDPAHTHLRDQWARVVFSVDLAATPRVVGKYINGFKHTTTVTLDGDALDSRFSLPPEFELFSDEDNERTDCYVNAIQIREGRMSDEEILALGGPDANGIPLPYSQWDFDDPTAPLAAKVGNDLQYINDTVSNLYELGITGQGNFTNVPGINGTAVRVLHIPFTGPDATNATAKLLGLKMNHGILPNGGGSKVNQWTMVMDLLWGDQFRIGFGAVFRTTNLGTPGDADMFWRASSFSYGKSCCSPYAGIDPAHTHLRNEWARVVFAVDLAATPRVVGKYINGFKHTTTVTLDGDALDSRFSLPPEFELFSDEDNERTECWISSLQIRQGRMSDDDIAALGGPSPQGIPTPNPVKGEWNFDEGNLKATVGNDLHYINDSVTNLYEFGTTGEGAFAAIPNINGKPAKVIHVPFTGPDATNATAKLLGLKVNHGILPNGGGSKVNQWTMIMDLYWGDQFRIGFGAVFRTTNLGTPGDADMFWRASSFSYGKSCCSPYAGIDPAHTHPRDQWARVVFSVDLAATPRVVGKYINGFKHTTTVTLDGDALDSRFSLPPEFELFSDEDNERTECYVNAIQIREGRMSDADIAALGGPDASGIPSAQAGSGSVSVPPPRFSNPVLSGGQVTITWTGTGTLLESTNLVNWAPVPGNPTSPYMVSVSSAARKFYRLQQ